MAIETRATPGREPPTVSPPRRRQQVVSVWRREMSRRASLTPSVVVPIASDSSIYQLFAEDRDRRVVTRDMGGRCSRPMCTPHTKATQRRV